MSTLFITCGVQGAGKTTLARSLEKEHKAIRFTPDEWLRELFPQQETRVTPEVRAAIESLAENFKQTQDQTFNFSWSFLRAVPIVPNAHPMAGGRQPASGATLPLGRACDPRSGQPRRAGGSGGDGGHRAA